MSRRRVLASRILTLLVVGAAFHFVGFAIRRNVPASSSEITSLLLSDLSVPNRLIQYIAIIVQENRTFDYLGSYNVARGIPQDTNAPATSLPCGGPLTYCAPTPVKPLPIPQTPPTVSTMDPFTGKGIMFRTPWSNSVAMRLTDGTTIVKKLSFGLFYAGQSDPAVRSPTLGARASQNCNQGSPTCYYIRVIGSGAVPKFVWVDGGTSPTQGHWRMGELCADNPHYKSTNGYTLGNAYNYGAPTGGVCHAPKFLQTPGSEGIVLDVELRTPTGARNKGLTGDDAWLVARDLTTCSSSIDVPETPVVDFSAFYRAFDPTHSKETQGYGPAFTESTATAISHSGVVSLQSGIYCATLSTFVGDDSHGTSVVCYDARLGRGHWFDAISGTAGPDTGGWGRSGVVTATCATSYCNPLLIYIKAVHLNFGLTPYLKLDMGNHAYWDMRGLNFTMIYPSVSERMGSDRVISDSSNQFFTWPLVDYSNRTAITFPPPNSWSKPSNYENKVVYPGGLYYNSNQITFTGPGDPGVAFISASNKNRVTPCVHDVGGTCGIYGVALDGSGTEYSFFPHFASMQQGGTADTVKSNLSAYIDSAGFTWIYWGSDWMGKLGCSDGVTASNCSAAGKQNRADVFAAVVQ